MFIKKYIYIFSLVCVGRRGGKEVSMKNLKYLIFVQKKCK